MALDPNATDSLPGIARRLRATRLALDKNQTEFCRLAEIAKNTYNQWEKAKGRPGLSEAIKLCMTYGLSLDWIYFGNPDALPFGLAEKIKVKLLELERAPHPTRPVRPMRQRVAGSR